MCWCARSALALQCKQPPESFHRSVATIVQISPPFIGVGFATLIPAGVGLALLVARWRASGWRSLPCAGALGGARAVASETGEDLSLSPPCCTSCCGPSCTYPLAWLLLSALLVTAFELTAVYTGSADPAAASAASGELPFVYSYLATSWVFLGLNVFLMNVAVFVVTAPDEPLSLDGMLRSLMMAHGVAPSDTLQHGALKHTLVQPSQRMLSTGRSDVEDAVLVASRTASPAAVVNALTDACAGEGHGQDSVNLQAARRLTVPRKLFMQSRSDRQVTAGVLYALALVVLGAYLGTNYALSEDTAASGRYVAFVVVAAMVLADVAVGLAYRGGAVGTPGEAMLVITLTRGVALAFGVDLWLLGLLAAYVMVGLWLGVAAVRAWFPALREAQAVASAAAAGGVAAVNSAHDEDGAFDGEDTDSLGGFPGEDSLHVEGRRPGALRRKATACILHPGSILFLVTAVFAALVASLAVASDSPRNLPDTRITLTDSSESYPQWHFAIAAIGIVLVVTMATMAFMFFESDRGVFRGIGFWCCVATCVAAAGAGIGMWALTDSDVILGSGLFLFPIVFGMAGLWGQFRADDFDVWRPGGLGCTRTCSCCYTRHQIKHEERMALKESRLLALSQGKRFKDDVSMPAGEAAPSLRAPPSDSDSDSGAELVEASSSDSDLVAFNETNITVTSHGPTKPHSTVTIAEWYTQRLRGVTASPAAGSGAGDGGLHGAAPPALSLLPETQDNRVVLASGELAVHYPCPEVFCCRVPRKNGGCSGCSCAPACTAHHWRNNYIMLTTVLVAACFVGFAFVASRSLDQPWILWFVTGEAGALLLLLGGLVVTVRTGGITWLAADLYVLGGIIHVLMHVYAWLQLDGGRAVASQAGSVDSSSSTTEEYGVALSLVLFPTLLVFAAALYEAISKAFRRLSKLSIAAAVLSTLVVLGMAVGGVVVMEAPVAVGGCLAAYVVFLVALAFFAKYKANEEHLPSSWARAGMGILALLLALGILATVLAATVQGSRTAALSWFSLTYLVSAFALFGVSVLVLTRSRILTEDVTGRLEATRITHSDTFLGGSTAIYLSDAFFPVFLASKNSVSPANKWPLVLGLSLVAVCAWAAALTVFITPVYIGLILLVIVKSLGVLFALDVTRRSQARLESAVRHLNGAFHAAQAAAAGTHTTPAAGTLTQGKDSTLQLTVQPTATAGDEADWAAAVQPDAQSGVHAALLRALHYTRQEAARDASGDTSAASGASYTVDVSQPLHGGGGAAASPPGDAPAVNADLAWLLTLFAEVEQAEIASVLIDARIQRTLRTLSYAAVCCGGGQVARPSADTAVRGGWSTSAVAAEENPPHAESGVPKADSTLAAAPAEEADGKAPASEVKGGSKTAPGAEIGTEGTVSAFTAAREQLVQLYLEQLEAEQRAVAAQQRVDWARATLSHSLITAGLAAAKAEGRAWRHFLQWVATQPLHVLAPHVRNGRSIATLRCLWVQLSGLGTSYETQPVDAATVETDHPLHAVIAQAVTGMPTLVPPMAGASRGRLFGFLRERAVHVPAAAAALQREAADVAALQAAWSCARMAGSAQESTRVQLSLRSAEARASIAPAFERRLSTSGAGEAKPGAGGAAFRSGGAAATPAPQSQWKTVAAPDRETPPPEEDFGGAPSKASSVQAGAVAPAGGRAGRTQAPAQPVIAARAPTADFSAAADDSAAQVGPSSPRSTTALEQTPAAAGQGSDEDAPAAAAFDDIMDFSKIRGGSGQPVDEEALAVVIAQLREIAAEFKASETPWEDDEFHGPGAIGGGVKAKIQQQWLRPAAFSPAPTLYEGTCDPSDIEQGSLGDCYLLTSMAIIAHDAQVRIEDIVVGPNPGWEAAGVYVVRLYKNSRWVPMLIDDRMPCKYVYVTIPNGNHTMVPVACSLFTRISLQRRVLLLPAQAREAVCWKAHRP